MSERATADPQSNERDSGKRVFEGKPSLVPSAQPSSPGVVPAEEENKKEGKRGSGNHQ